MNLVRRNSFPKLSNLPQYFTQLGKFRGEANNQKHEDPRKRIESVGNHVKTVGTC